MNLRPTVDDAFARWLAREDIVGLRLCDVLPKGDYLSLLFWKCFHGEDPARRFAEHLRTEHPELGGPHLVFMVERDYDHPPDEQAAAFVAEHARDFANAYLHELAKTQPHGLRVADDVEIFEYEHAVDDPEIESGIACAAQLWIEGGPAAAEVAATLDRMYRFEPDVRITRYLEATVRLGVVFAHR